MAEPERVRVVGLGASAGGIEAFRSFFQQVPARPGLAFVVILHLSPERESLLSEILGRWTSMPVAVATDGMQVEADHVYVNPPGGVVRMKDSRLQVVAATPTAPRATVIDAFFASLATDYGEAAVGVVLSGTGHDGSLGLTAIKQCGGITLVQGSDPQTSASAPQHDGMPVSAIATGAVDLVLPVEDMPARLLALVRARGTADPEETLAGVREEICRRLRETVGHDFSGYKEPTFLRRVQRRMQVLGLDPGRYVARLQADPTEASALFRDLLIGVTSFFRDADTFAALDALALPRLFDGRGPTDTIRVWVPGCATGEEAYSIAMILSDHAERLAHPPKVQIFATDLDETAIGIARAGRYPASLVRDMVPDRLARFFVRDDHTYVVTKALRELCTFSGHSVVRDPPFSRMDLISCRNLLIYFDVDLQSQVFPAFHYALVRRGLLLLGGAESVTRHADLFAPLDRKHCIFARVDRPSPPLHVSATALPRRAAGFAPRDRDGMDRAQAVQLAQARIHDRHTPAWALVTAEGDALHHSPRTGRYLEIAAGAPTRNLVAQARPGLRLALRGALAAARDGFAVTREGVAIQIDGGTQHVALTVEPIGSDGTPLFLVVFADEGRRAAGGEAPGQGPDATIEQLERELREAREQNQSVGEEYEAALGELKSANEELYSVNEELQSSNEELETGKEELQSVNEELQTVNHQLTGKIEELDRSSSDLRNVFESTQIATVFLDRSLRIRGFTPAIAGVYNLIAADLGRPLADIASSLDRADLQADLQRVLATLEPFERRVSRRDGEAHYLMRILPYRGNQDRIDGALVTFADVTSMVEAEEHNRLMVDELNHRVRNMLTVVISLATQTLRRAATLESFGTAFLGRLHAMSTAYTLVSRESWTEVGLDAVLADALAPYAPRGEATITTDGPEVFLSPKAALTLGMVIHELATNAVRHGALSVSEGHVTVRWQVDPRSGVFSLRWSEHNGPPVAEPGHLGFGTSLIERSVRHELGGRAALRFLPEGVEAVLTVPADPLLLSRTSRTPDADG